VHTDLTRHLTRALADDRVRSPIEAHRYSLPVVREVVPPGAQRRLSQRALVVASLLLSDREDQSTSSRWA
jgi:hypothetical protein